MTPEERAALIKQINKMRVPMTQLDPLASMSKDVDSSIRDMVSRLADNPNIEQSGLVISQPDGTYQSSLPVTQNHHDDFTMQMQLHKGQKVGGIFHVHPGNDDDGQYFSPGDLETAAKFNVPSYILFMKDHSLRKYVPGTTPTMQIFGPHSKLTVAKGDALPDPNDQALAQALKSAQANQTPTPVQASPQVLAKALESQ